MHPEQNPIIKLNVGGTIFETTYQTLNQSSNYFTQYILPFNLQTPFFIDRDPLLFQYILNYLRGHSLYLNDDSPLSSLYMQKRLQEEAKFYGLIDLERALEYHIQNSKQVPTPLHQLWQKLENTRREFEQKRDTRSPSRSSSSPDYYPPHFDLDLHPRNRPAPSKQQIQEQIQILENQMREWRIEDQITETKNFLLQSVRNLQTLAPNSLFTQNLDQHIEQFYQENAHFFRQLATNSQNKAQQIPELINKFLHFIWAKGIEQTPEENLKTQTPFDVLFQLLSNLTGPDETHC